MEAPHSGSPGEGHLPRKGVLSRGLLEDESEEPAEGGGLGNRRSDSLEYRTRAGGHGCPGSRSTNMRQTICHGLTVQGDRDK